MRRRTARDRQIVVRRRSWRQWYLAPVGAVMFLHGGGVVYGWQPAARILELIYPTTDPPAFETRDLAWAWAFLIVGAWLVLLTLSRLAAWRPAVRADAEGLTLSVGSPLRRPVPVPWDQVRSVSAGSASDDYSTYPTLLVGVEDPDLFRFRLWGAAWLDDGTLSIAAGDWATKPLSVVGRLADMHTSPDPEDESLKEDPRTPTEQAATGRSAAVGDPAPSADTAPEGAPGERPVGRAGGEG